MMSALSLSTNQGMMNSKDSLLNLQFLYHVFPLRRNKEQIHQQFGFLSGMLFQSSGSEPTREVMGLEFLEKTKANIEEDRKEEKDMLIAEGEFRSLCLNNCVTVYDCSVII